MLSQSYARKGNNVIPSPFALGEDGSLTHVLRVTDKIGTM